MGEGWIGEGHVRTEAETGGMCPHVTEQLEPSEGGRVKKASSLDSSGVVCPGRHLGFGLLASRAVGESISVALSHQVCFSRPRKQTQRL